MVTGSKVVSTTSSVTASDSCLSPVDPDGSRIGDEGVGLPVLGGRKLQMEGGPETRDTKTTRSRGDGEF